jgi:hypothetical protein
MVAVNRTRHSDGAISDLRDIPANPRKARAEERTRTADLFSLRVIHQVLQGFARACKSPINRPLSFLCLALCCTVLRSRWYQDGITIALISARHAYPRVVLFNLDTSALTHATDRWDQPPYRHSRHGAEKGPSNLVSQASWPIALEHRLVGARYEASTVCVPSESAQLYGHRFSPQG